ncbi:Crp/Fnr family transcriptional regulator (plasmid) [Agrobacterium sp. rho-13.3]|uniref:Crp/Fnr family transcriptional regulator n=1 Tax=Agrobacterium sp. rho-13.3 TaxID=3072980 RepID=UPI002A11EED4|nr:Crp/Fnr family transcriptional regulator [Agrobacterium sp. rho-13.3]MDX8312116.1 Crp/Fnr family transcriptional regulator [Agrobacterium sp. rho-13.3]
MIEKLLLNLRSHDVVTVDEEAALFEVITRTALFQTGDDIVAQGSRPRHSTLLLDGFSARYKILEDGSRQITALHVPGDFVDLHAFTLKTMDHGIVAMSVCKVAFAEHSDLQKITETQPHLTRLLWLDTIVDGAIHREWIVAMGRRSKKSHLAHLICELYLRLQVVGLVEGWSFRLPLSQGEIADVLGLSLVHLNKTLQLLRQDGVIRWENKTVEILRWEELAQLAEFDATYLSLTVEPR